MGSILRQKVSKPVSEVMNKNVIVVSFDDTLATAVALMQQHRISSLVITRYGRPDGIFTERDLMRTIKRNEEAHSAPIKDYMTESVITADIDTDIYDAFNLFDTYGIRHLVITRGEGFIAGVVSQSDIMNNLGLEHFVEIKKVSGIMSPKVVTLGPDDTVFDAVSMMASSNISCVVVADHERKPLGILTERDIVDLFLDRVIITECRLSESMSSPVRTLPIDAPAHEAARAFNEYKLRRLVIVDDRGTIAGIITQRDFIRGPMKDGYSGILLEIIHRKDQLIREAKVEIAGKEFYENILRSLPDIALSAMDIGFRIRYFNSNAGTLLNYDSSDVMGKTVMELHDNAMVSPAHFMEALNAVCEKGNFKYIMRIDKGDAGIVTVESTVSCIVDASDKLAGYLMLSRPVHEP